MKALFNCICLLLSVVAMIFTAGCGGSPADRLDTASRLVNERPDSAYTILREIYYDDFDSDSLKAKYILTKALADIRVGRSLITDTLLEDASAYYISAGDTAKWVIASQLMSGYDFMRGDAESALHRLDAMVTRIKNPGLLWDTYIHLLEVSINSGNYACAFNYADWLSRHTDVAEQKLKFAAAKAGARYMQGEHQKAMAVYDSVIATGIAKRVSPDVSREFYTEYAEVLDGAGHPREAIALMDSLYGEGGPLDDVEEVCRKVSMAQFHADAGDIATAMEFLDSINHDGTQSVFEVYAYIGMLKSALEFRQKGRFPAELMKEVTKNMHRNYRFAQFDRQTAMESVIELNNDNYELKLQRQRLWLLICGISLLVVVSVVGVYFILSRRKQRIIEAEERAETLEQMLEATRKAEAGDDRSSDNNKLKAALLRQLGIFKIFAGTPTPQSREALRKISTVGNDGVSIESLVDWTDFYSMIDSLYDGFHSKLINNYPGLFNDKEQQIIVLLKAGFSTKEIGVLTEQSSATIYTRKSVIRKKLSTPENGDFIAQLEA